MGNLRSVLNAFRAVGAEARVAGSAEDLGDASGVVLPGVGAFGDGIRNLRARGFAEALESQVLRGGKPFLGICLGQQLLGTMGLEYGKHAGLDWIPGVVDRLPVAPPLRLPHIGWNDVRFEKREGLYAGLGETQAFYFVHSFALRPRDPDVVSGVCGHGMDFTASLERDNIYATQFHPEKSHRAGLAVLRNWAEIVRRAC